MKKILLIEDRIKRQNEFLELHDISLEYYSDILVNLERERLFDILEDIVQDNIKFEKFDIIICHKSIEYNDKNSLIISNLKDYCKSIQKTLVLFSGGTPVNFYDDSDFELLELNSKTFYSQNLSIFLEAIKSQNEDVTMLCYGKKWKENIVANTLEETNLFITDVQSGFENITNFQVDPKLTKLQYEFYRPNEKNIDEIRKYKDSLEKYFQLHFEQKISNNSVIIHHDNVCNPQIFNHHIKFIQGSDDIDSYISNEIIKDLCSKEFDTIFIKDNLSSNYLELYGLRVAHHIRLSSILGNKRFTPIVIISDFNEYTLNKFSTEANILFTQGIYLCKNTYEDIKYYQSLKLDRLKNYGRFLETINIQRPKDTSGNHDISNKWSIYRWAETLGIESNSIIKNNKEIEDTLYFKYLITLNKKEFDNNRKVKKLSGKGKVLLIDDEWDKGWNDILNKVISRDGVEFKAFEYNYKDKTFGNFFFGKLKNEINSFNPDIVVLDLRLSQNDHESDDIDNYTGIKILEKIHEINAGIQVIMLTATSKSTILEKLYEKKILGYIKKEHPEDKSINTIENINKFIGLINKGLERKYLKEIFNIKEEINDILKVDIFKQYKLQNGYVKFWNKLKTESISIFDILDNGGENKFLYAMVSISSALETIITLFIKENWNRPDQFWDGKSFRTFSKGKEKKALGLKLEALFKDKLSFENFKNIDMTNCIRDRNSYLHTKKIVNVSSIHITDWFKRLSMMIKILENPPKINNKVKIPQSKKKEVGLNVKPKEQLSSKDLIEKFN